MLNLILRWLLNALGLLLVAFLIPGIAVSGWYAALIVIIILGLINAFIRPLIIILTLPINILTLGLFTLVINGLLFWFVASIIEGFEVTGFWPAFWGALIFSIISWAVSTALKE